MGLPINKLICASNENKVLTDFFKTGVYDRRRELQLTSSPSMDILISSNLERLLYHLDDKVQGAIPSYMDQLTDNGFYQIDKKYLNEFYGNYATEEEVAETINKVYGQYDYLLDTHTAVAYNVVKKYQKESGDNTKTVIVSTASPYKFASAVASSIGIDVDKMDEFQVIDRMSKKTGVDIPKSIEDLKTKEILHQNNCNKEDMRSLIEDFLGVGEPNA